MKLFFIQVYSARNRDDVEKSNVQGIRNNIHGLKYTFGNEVTFHFKSDSSRQYSGFAIRIEPYGEHKIRSFFGAKLTNLVQTIFEQEHCSRKRLRKGLGKRDWDTLRHIN